MSQNHINKHTRVGAQTGSLDSDGDAEVTDKEPWRVVVVVQDVAGLEVTNDDRPFQTVQLRECVADLDHDIRNLHAV